MRRLGATLVVGALVVVGCSTDDVANQFLDDQGIEINTRGGVPSSFPTDVPLPDLAIETAVAVQDGFVLRLTSPDAVSDVASYRVKLEAAGFSITDAFDNSANDAYNVGLTAHRDDWTVQSVAFVQGKPGDTGYMGLTVDPVDGAGPRGEPADRVDPAALLPTGFPADVPVPELPIETASVAGDGYSVKLTSTDAAADIAAYRTALTASGGTIESEYDHLDDDSKNAGFSAVLGTWEIRANALARNGDSGGYLVLSVDPAD